MSSQAHSENVTIDQGLHLHVCSARMFFMVYAALLVLTVITVAVAQADFGGFNMTIAMAIAAAKAALVMAIFMHFALGYADQQHRVHRLDHLPFPVVLVHDSRLRDPR